MTLPDLTDRGYTGHEHLEDFQLINMNGRIYDPIIHQMTGPDILDANPYSTQAYNRYAYVMNNPMKYVDPSGYRRIYGHYWKEWNVLRIDKITGWIVSWEVIAEKQYYIIEQPDYEFSFSGDLQLDASTGTGGGYPSTLISPKIKKVIDDTGLGVSIETTMVEAAAKSVATTIEGANIVAEIGRFAGKTNFIVGGAINAYDSLVSFQKGDYTDGAIQGAEAVAYVAVGIIVLTASAPVVVTAAAVSIAVLTAVDVIEYFWKPWK